MAVDALAGPDLVVIPLVPGYRRDWQDGTARIEIRTWDGDDLGAGAADLDATHYGMVARGTLRIERPGMEPAPLAAGCYSCMPGPVRFSGGDSSGLLVTLHGYWGLAQFGGPIETTGRLRYLDGGTDTLLVAPPRRGDPCLNHLHLPPGCRQTAHTHPSVRIGLVLRGTGACRTEHGLHRLTPGLGWLIPADCLHAFHTEGDAMDVLAWHPDSDYGPTDEDHPMLNRTVIR